MRTIDEIVNELDTEQINEAVLNEKQLIFTPVKTNNKEIPFGVAVGNIFTIKKEKYCIALESSLKLNFGLEITTGINKAKSVIKQASTKLIYLIYNQNKVMICNSDVCKALDGTKLT